MDHDIELATLKMLRHVYLREVILIQLQLRTAHEAARLDLMRDRAHLDADYQPIRERLFLLEKGSAKLN